MRTLCNWKKIKIIEAEVCPDHVHMLVEIPPKVAVPEFTAEELHLELEEPLNYYAQRDRGFIGDRVCQTILTRQKEHNKEYTYLSAALRNHVNSGYK